MHGKKGDFRKKHIEKTIKQKPTKKLRIVHASESELKKSMVIFFSHRGLRGETNHT